MYKIRWAKEVLTLADITEPDVLKSAGTLAVNTLQLVGTNDDVGDGSTILKDEDSGSRSSVLVGVASTSTVVLLVSVILGASDGLRLGERDDATNTGWDLQGLGRGHGGQNGSEDGSGELHFESVVGLLCWLI